MAKKKEAAGDNPWDHWVGMPEFVNEDLTSWKAIKVHFASQEDMDEFARLVGQTVPGRGPGGSIWYPEAKVAHYVDKRYVAVSS